jgi:hypothetical protein
MQLWLESYCWILCMDNGPMIYLHINYNHRILVFSLFSMTPLGNAKIVILLRCRLLVHMTNGLKLSYYQGNTRT